MFSEELDLQPDVVREVGGWLAEGKLRYREPVRDGPRTPWTRSSP
ncbi:hypothetical protein [Streptomyces cellulosae]|uniref:Uncharacterized protein n=1 Tax=Streptomyces cellulosae TaxID=1968 RepID=A0ABW7YCQ0_STRCE